MAGRRERRAANRAPLPRSAPDPTSRSTPSAGSAIRSAGRAALPCDRQIPTVPNRDAPCPAPNSPRQLRRSRYFCKILAMRARGCSMCNRKAPLLHRGRGGTQPLGWVGEGLPQEVFRLIFSLGGRKSAALSAAFAAAVGGMRLRFSALRLLARGLRFDPRHDRRGAEPMKPRLSVPALMLGCAVFALSAGALAQPAP